MDTKFQTSFIPKKPVIGTNTRRASGGIFYVISVIIFVFSVVLTVGVFAYGKYVDSSIQKMQSQLSDARTALQPSVIEEISRVNTRFESAKTLLSTHVILTELFNLLETKTLQSLRFGSFSYQMDDSRKVQITMRGEANSYATVALQSKIFSEDSNFVNPQFADLDLNKDGNVTFNFKTNINPKLLFYSTVISNTAPTADTSAPASTTPDTSMGGGPSQATNQ